MRKTVKFKVLLPLIIVVLFSLPSCYLLETKTDPTTGKETTNLETLLTKVDTGIKSGAPIINALAPGVETIAGGVGVLLSLIGGLTTSIMVAKRRGRALAAVIKGVQLANDEDTKNKIKDVSGALGVEPYLHKVYRKYFPVNEDKNG